MMMIASSDEDPDRERRLLRAFESRGVEGVLAAPAGEDVRPYLDALARGTPSVLLDFPSPSPLLASVAVDHVAGGRLAAEHLLSLGHREIVLLNGPDSIRQCRDRRTGALDALARAGIGPEHLIEVRLASLDAAGGDAALEAWLAAEGAPPTALFCVNDMVAIGAIRALRRRGLDGEGGTAIVGYDDSDVAADLATPLTTVRQPAQELGQRAASLLEALHDGVAPAERVVFAPELVVRASTRPGLGGRGPGAAVGPSPSGSGAGRRRARSLDVSGP
jgi:LacI family transcriptional regulator